MDDRRRKPYFNKNGEREAGFYEDGEWIPSKSKPISDNSGFTTYDNSQGHCPLCGRLTCNGGCFK